MKTTLPDYSLLNITTENSKSSNYLSASISSLNPSCSLTSTLSSNEYSSENKNGDQIEKCHSESNPNKICDKQIKMKQEIEENDSDQFERADDVLIQLNLTNKTSKGDVSSSKPKKKHDANKKKCAYRTNTSLNEIKTLNEVKNDEKKSTLKFTFV